MHVCGIYMCICCACVWYIHVWACVWCVHVCGIYMYVCGVYMCVHAVQVHSPCLSCGGQRPTLNLFLCCSHLGTYLGQMFSLFMLQTLLPGVAVRIKKLTSVKVLGRLLMCSSNPGHNVYAQGHSARSKYKLLSPSLGRMPS